jgi:outer membrane lipopolysaccharide assembly protein LptE/RlpB
MGSSKRIQTLCLFLLATTVCGCSYRLAGARSTEGRGRSIGVPTFVNRTTTYKIEQRLAEAVRRELIRRTRYEVRSEQTADVVVTGEVLTFSAIPIIFNQQGRASSYSIVVDMNVVVRDTGSGQVLFQNDRWAFRDVFELAQNSAEFVPEDTAAIDRLARRFASSLVASMLYANP